MQTIVKPRSQPLGRRASAPGRGLEERFLPDLLFVLFLAYTFVGLSPLYEPAADERADGSLLGRLALLALVGLSALILALRPQTTLRILVRSWPLWLMGGWLLASTAWSHWPDLTARRATATLMFAVICLAIVTTDSSLRRLHGLMTAVLTGVILFDFVAIACFPAFAFTEIGVRGIHPQKNPAGVIAMLAVLSAATWTAGARRSGTILLGLACTILAGAFLVLTQSKTSIGLALLGLAVLPMLLMLVRLGAAASLLIALCGFCVLATMALLYLGAGGDAMTLIGAGGDATFTGRDEIWSFAASEIAKAPLLGVGYGAFWDVGVENDPLLRAPPGWWLSQVKIGIINQAHNGYLDLLLQLGTVGLLLALFLLFRTMKGALALLFLSQAPERTRSMALFCVLTLLALTIHNMTESSLWFRGQPLGDMFVLIALFVARGRGEVACIGTGPASRPRRGNLGKLRA